MNRTLLWISLSLFLFPACSTDRLAVRMAVPMIESQYQVTHEEQDPAFARSAIPGSLKMLEGMLRLDPANTSILLRLSDGFCNYAFSFIETEDPERASSLYLRGREYALRALAAAGGPGDLPDRSLPDFKQAISSLDAGAMPALYWVGRCWAGWLMLNLDNLQALAAISKLEVAMKPVLAWDESYDYGGPHLFFGSFFGSRSKMLGGDPEQARSHFVRNLELTDKKFLMTYILYARYVAVQTQDRELYVRLLKQVLDAPPGALPERRLANEVAKNRALEMLEATDDYF